MKPESEQDQRWEDIIFEKRNKEYGAYAIRKSYNDRVITGWIVSVGVGGLILLCSFISSRNEVPPITDPEGPIITILPPPTITEPIVNPPQPPPARQVNRDLPPVATPNPVDDTPTPPVQPLTSGGTEGSGTPVEGNVFSGAGEVEVPVDVPAPPPYMLAPEVMPSYEGGYEGMMRFLQRKLRYPPSAVSRKQEGTVYVSFIINSNGEVTEVEVIRGFYKDCDKEAVRVISMMNKWKPGKQNKMPVAVKMVLPIKFELGN